MGVTGKWMSQSTDFASSSPHNKVKTCKAVRHTIPINEYWSVRISMICTEVIMSMGVTGNWFGAVQTWISQNADFTPPSPNKYVKASVSVRCTIPCDSYESDGMYISFEKDILSMGVTENWV